MTLPQQLKWLWVILLFLPLVFTTKVQFSCYPLITNGELPQVCYQEPNISKIIQDKFTHGNVLYNLASKSSDESILRKLSSNLDISRVDYDSQILQVELLGNKNTPPDLSENIFTNLINDQTQLPKQLLSKLARNPNTPDSTLQRLISNNSDDSTNYLISSRTQLSSATITLLFDKVKSSQSSYYKDDILSNIASQENTSLEIMKILLEQAKIVEKLGDGSECPIYKGLAKNPNLEEKLGSRNAKFIINRSFDLTDCKKKPCEPKTKQHLGWGVGAGIAVMTGVLIVGSGGLLAPIAIAAGAIAGGTAYAASQFLNRCP
ncbi:hypothetical protein VKI22_01445 [Cyanobacterium aponinum UTEX 3221]|uniref:hypothetical protein n=1 Tax=Cyanobacterium aponinum TaxID=379064 RepID=UPI002B4BD5D0|nr:hypothetical protein [Cyanobacterium aponinum]WRL38789.1 hypothetical protein VKI22_01445 [Cyanobacterium aponinum UTEX 3221]